MDLQPHSTSSINRPGTQGGSERHLQRYDERSRQGILLERGYQRLIARGTLLVIAVLALLLFIAALPYHADHLHVLCQNILCGSSQTVSQVTRELHQIGLTRDYFTAYGILIESCFGFVYLMIAALLFWRKSDNLMALIVAAFLITFVLAVTDIPQELQESNAWLRWLAACMGFLGEMAFPLCFYLFPNGRFVPRWTRWLLLGWLLWGILEYFFPGASFHTSNWFLVIESLAFAVGLGSIVLSQVYHYRFVSTPTQRQQTKWVVSGIIIALAGFFAAGFVGFVLPGILLPAHSQPVSTLAIQLSIFANGSVYLVLLFIPISLAIALLRYRLWEIDALINKALVYGLLSVLLAAIYAGLIISLESGVQLFAPPDAGPIIIVVSTLIIATLFHPLRQRIQIIIDRRFYRRKYDAARTLETFSALMRNEVDLSQLSEYLLAVVEETMEPAHVSLWLRKDEPERTS